MSDRFAELGGGLWGQPGRCWHMLCWVKAPSDSSSLYCAVNTSGGLKIPVSGSLSSNTGLALPAEARPVPNPDRAGSWLTQRVPSTQGHQVRAQPAPARQRWQPEAPPMCATTGDTRLPASALCRHLPCEPKIGIAPQPVFPEQLVKTPDLGLCHG